MFQSIIGHWQSTLFGLLTGLTGALYAATQSGNLTPAQFWTVLVASALAAVKGAVSADGSKAPVVK